MLRDNTRYHRLADSSTAPDVEGGYETFPSCDAVVHSACGYACLYCHVCFSHIHQAHDVPLDDFQEEDFAVKLPLKLSPGDKVACMVEVNKSIRECFPLLIAGEQLYMESCWPSIDILIRYMRVLKSHSIVKDRSSITAGFVGV